MLLQLATITIQQLVRLILSIFTNNYAFLDGRRSCSYKGPSLQEQERS